MSQKIAKKIRKATRHNYMEYVKALMEWPYIARWRFAWYLINPIKEVKKMIRRVKWNPLKRLKG